MPLMVLDRSAPGEPPFRHVRRAPSGIARVVVRESWTVQAARCRTAVERALPDPLVEIYINLGPAGRQIYSGGERPAPSPRSAWIVGPHAGAILVEKELRDCDLIGVRLELGQASLVLGVPVAEVAGAGLLDLDLFWGPEVELLRQRLHDSADPVARLDLLEAAVADRATRGTTTDEGPVVRSLCAAIAASARCSVAELAAAHGLTHRRTIALIEGQVGLKPKLLQRVQRIRGVLRDVHTPGRTGWTCIALRAGYYDQAHMINDFQALASLTPVEYEARRSSVGRGFARHLTAIERPDRRPGSLVGDKYS